MYQIRYTENARRELEEIFSFITQNSLENALSFLDKLNEHLEGVLSVFPNSGTLYDKDRGIRKHSYEGYTAFYHVPSKNMIKILHVVHLGKPLTIRRIEF